MDIILCTLKIYKHNNSVYLVILNLFKVQMYQHTLIKLNVVERFRQINTFHVLNSDRNPDNNTLHVNYLC